MDEARRRESSTAPSPNGCTDLGKAGRQGGWGCSRAARSQLAFDAQQTQRERQPRGLRITAKSGRAQPGKKRPTGRGGE